jgi:hypothetical protein
VAPDERVPRLTSTSGTTGQPRVVAMTQRLTRAQREGSPRYPDDPGHAWDYISLYPLMRRGNQCEVETALCLGRTVLFSALDAFVADRARFESFRTSLASGDAMTLARMVAGGTSQPRPGTLTFTAGTCPGSRAVCWPSGW